MKFLKNIYYKYIKNNNNITVSLRGKLSNIEQKEYKILSQKYFSNLTYLKKSKSHNNILEIGFGNGHHIVELCKYLENKNIFGSELYKQGILNTMLKIEKIKIDSDNKIQIHNKINNNKEKNNTDTRKDNKLNLIKIEDENSCENKINNIKILEIDGRKIIDNIDNNFFERIYILFPDPWQKARHKKRRILQKDFIYKCLLKIHNNGLLIIATDWQDYADMIKANIDNINIKKENIITKLYIDKLKTKFKKNNNLQSKILFNNHLYKSIYKIEENNSENKFNIYHNVKNYNTIIKNNEIKNIVSSTFAKRALKENRKINIFIIQK